LKRPPKKSRPYLEENVVSGDKFNIFAFGGLLTLIFFIGLWVYSSSDLFGNFFQWVGIIKTPVPVIAIKENLNTEGNSVQFFEINNQTDKQPMPHQGKYPANLAELSQVEDRFYEDVVVSDVTINEPEIEETPIPKVLTLLPTITPEGPQAINNVDYDINDVYLRSAYLRSVYGSLKPDYTIPGKYSYYWPPWGGMNCDKINGVEECVYMASGEKALENVGIAWACDFSIPLQSVIYIRELDIFGICKDRGYAIKQDIDGLFWFDQLLDYGLLGWAEEMTVDVYVNE